MHMLATRLHEGQDLKKAIEAFVQEQHISAGTVISGVGSLNVARLRMAGASADNQDILDYPGPLEIASLIGNVGQNRTHLHMSVSDWEGQLYGGHLKEGCIVHTTVELVIAVSDDLQFSEEADPETGFGELSITEKA